MSTASQSVSHAINSGRIPSPAEACSVYSHLLSLCQLWHTSNNVTIFFFFSNAQVLQHW
jgi:hypothetical protein